MWRLFIFLLLLVASVWLGVEIMRHPGYLLLVYQPWMVQMPLWFAFLSVLAILGIFYLLITSIDKLHFLWFKLKNWLRIHREHKAYSKTQHGLSLLIEGRFKKAERLLLAGVNQSIEPLMNYLGAARAAQELQAVDRRDEYIKKAYQVAPDAKLAIGITQVELQFKENQFEQAAATLQHLREYSPKHPRLLVLQEKALVRLGDWSGLKALLPRLRKAKVLNAAEYDLFEKNIYVEILNAANLATLDELHTIWGGIPRSLKKHHAVILAYVLQLRRFTDTKEQEDLIRKALKNSWQPELAQIYSDLPFMNVSRQLVIAGAWLKMYGPQPILLCMLGKFCVEAGLWGKAKDYFEKCLAQGRNADASFAYGKLLEHLNEPEQALQQYKAGLGQVIN
ncbi:MAG: heme biosynthesis HemY N-terminal domain-containing protein [Gammaproteobacteria bacterium]